MTLTSIKRRIRRDLSSIRAVCGYVQGDVWVLKHNGSEWVATNDTTQEVHRNHQLSVLCEYLNTHHGVRVWAVL